MSSASGCRHAHLDTTNTIKLVLTCLSSNAARDLGQSCVCVCVCVQNEHSKEVKEISEHEISCRFS